LQKFYTLLGRSWGIWNWLGWSGPSCRPWNSWSSIDTEPFICRALYSSLSVIWSNWHVKRLWWCRHLLCCSSICA